MSHSAAGYTSGPGSVDAAAAGARITVMVADDHPIWRDAVARDLSEAGFDVVATAADGAEAVRRGTATRPRVVVLDMQMPQLSGAEVTARLVAADPNVKVLVLSARGEHDDVLQALKAGATGIW